MNSLLRTTFFFPFVIFASLLSAQSDFSVLHYTETSGFDHNTRSNSLAMMQAMGAQNDFDVVDDQTGSEFNSLANLQQFDVVIFSNTSGNNILSATQRANFEAYIAGGGSYVGIHAASDTYRHSTANGGSTGTWDFYAELIGASVQNSPNHVSGQPTYDMDKIGVHPTTTNVPAPWTKAEEYYYWENGYYDATNNVVLEVEQTVGPNGQVNDYDAARPTSWVREPAGGGRVFYTSLGHANSNFTNDNDFRDLIRDAILWTSGREVSMDMGPTQSSYLGATYTIPGTIEAEFYDEGGQGVAYNDDGSHSGSTTFRDDEDVDVVDKANASNQLAVGYTSAGEWTEYTVDIAAGEYDIALSYASNSNNAGDIELEVDGETIALFADIPSTGNWNTFETRLIEGVVLEEATEAVLRITVVGAGNIDYDALTFSAVLPPQPLSLGAPVVSGEGMRYHKTTISWEGPQLIEEEATFMDYRLDVAITTPDGSTHTVPGYFAGDGEAAESSASAGMVWRCHFLPETVGEYSFSATLRTGDDIAFADYPVAVATETATSTGIFSVTETDKTGDDFRAKGKLKYVGEHHLRFSDGDYFLKVGANSPETFLEYEEFDNTPTSRTYPDHIADWQVGDPTWQNEQGKGIIGAVNYLSDVGLNAHYFMVNSAFGDGDDTYPWNSPTDIYNYDVSKLEQWQIVFDHMMSKGMMCNIVLSETENESYFEIVEDVVGGFADARKVYYRELVARFGYLQAVTWNIGEENGWDAGGTYGAGNSTQQRIDYATYLDGLLYSDDNITVHNGPSSNDDIFDELLGEEAYTGISYQGNIGQDQFGHTKILEQITSSAASGQPWVVSYDEPYTGATPYPVDNFRKNSLWAALTAGANGVEAYIGGSDQSLQDYREQSAAWETLARAHRFFVDEEIPFWMMENRDTDVGEDAWCLALDNEVYVIYFENNGTTDLDLGDDGEYGVQWYDPRNGGALQDGSITTIQGPGETAIGDAPTTAGTDDWVALVRRIEVSADCPSDIDGSGVVDVADFISLNSSFGQVCSECAADINDDGAVTVGDFLLFNSQFGTVCE